MPEKFVASLSSYHASGVFNPWGDIDLQHDLDDRGPEVRQRQLLSYLQERIAARFDEGTDLSDQEVLERSMKIERRMVYQEHCDTVQRLMQTIQAEGGAVAGLEDVLRHLNAGAVEEVA